MQCECCHWDRKKTPAIKDAMPADGTLLAALATNGDNGTSGFHGSSWSVEPSDIILYQERGASKRSSRSAGVPLAYTGFLLSGTVMS